METIKGVIRSKLRERPFDFLVAAFLFLAGLNSLVNDNWPENLGDTIFATLAVIVSLYFMVASAIIMLSLSCKRHKRPVMALMGEMYGWMFVCGASIATFLMYASYYLSIGAENTPVFVIMATVWLGMAIASGTRFYDLFLVYRSLKR